MNNKFASFNEFLATQSVQVPILSFLLNLILAAILGYLLSKIYVKYGKALSNRKRFSSIFVILAMTTMVIITIVKSSLALSLGLVGALSIVRFRAAIKDPEELAYLFLTIGIGLGLGADQVAITLIGFCTIICVIWLNKTKKTTSDFYNLFLTISSQKASSVDFSIIMNILKKHCEGLSLRRLDESGENIEATYVIDIDSFERFEQCRTDIHKYSPDINITFLDNRGID
ncbi:MAG: DUF4956 domain-containing protein [Deltaproteobacteria bacterium]|uniref:DUF4956 domain-containing protein n=1 Tax=Desulfobacula sp. TaxID=2593537 RepID=UPI0019B200EB|nr:DUF4956 domain-containing protein [Candidatus Desulfobacula maris]MBL6992772.1 DUF4956 domain-containing protein [Desulfobacula sp.]